jgi:hypothetical protein
MREKVGYSKIRKVLEIVLMLQALPDESRFTGRSRVAG